MGVMAKQQAWESSEVLGTLVSAQLWWELGWTFIHSFIRSFKTRFLEHSPSAKSWQAGVKERSDDDGYKDSYGTPPAPVF